MVLATSLPLPSIVQRLEGLANLSKANFDYETVTSELRSHAESLAQLNAACLRSEDLNRVTIQELQDKRNALIDDNNRLATDLRNATEMLSSSSSEALFYRNNAIRMIVLWLLKHYNDLNSQLGKIDLGVTDALPAKHELAGELLIDAMKVLVEMKLPKPETKQEPEG
jgi:hypothetical protein